jgi:hypothetical protein
MLTIPKDKAQSMSHNLNVRGGCSIDRTSNGTDYGAVGTDYGAVAKSLKLDGCVLNINMSSLR